MNEKTNHRFFRSVLDVRRFDVREAVDPQGTTYRLWWSFTAFMALFTGVYVPYSVGFGAYNGVPPYASGSGAVQILLDAWFLLDMIVQFNLAYPDEEGKLVCSRKRIARRYVMGTFWADLLALFPFNALVLASAGKIDQPNSVFAQYSSLSRLLQLIRLYRIAQLQEKLLFYRGLSLNSIIIARTIASFLFLGNFFASGFYFIANLQGVYEDSYMSEFLESFGPLNGFQRYLLTFYFMINSILTTVGYGDLRPVTTAEQVWCMLCILVGISNLAHVQFNMFLIAKSDPKSGSYRDASNLLKSYCKENSLQDLEPSMQQQLRLQYVYAEVSDEVVLCNFPGATRARLLSHVYRDIVLQNPLFAGLEQSYIEDYIGRCTVEVFIPGMTIIEQGVVSTRLYVMIAGEITTEMATEAARMDSFTEFLGHSVHGRTNDTRNAVRNMIADVSFLTRTPQTHQVKAKTTCKTLTLTRAAFDDLSVGSPSSTKRIYNNLLDILKSEVELLNERGSDRWKGWNRAGRASKSIWLPRYRKAIDAVRMSISRQRNKHLSVFLQMAFAGDLPGIQASISEGFEVNSSNYDGRTALMIASSRGYKSIVLALLKAGADVNLVDSRSHSALLEAVLFGHEGTMKVLMEHGASLCTPLLKQASLLCMATYEGDLALVRRLLVAGVSPSSTDYGGKTALDVAVCMGNLPAVRLLSVHVEGSSMEKNAAIQEAPQLMKAKVDEFFASKASIDPT